MTRITHALLSIFHLGLVSFVLSWLFFVACSDKPGSSHIKIHVVGKVSDKNSFAMANVEIQLTKGIYNVLRTTQTSLKGEYSLVYYGKCNRSDPGTTLFVRIRAPDGFYPDLPASHMLLCTEDTQTFNFQLIKH